MNKTALISNERSDVIIVGAGVAGSALAFALAKDGRRVHVIERDLTEPKRIVGEVLQPGGYLKLIELGLEDCVTEIDTEEFVGYVLYKDGQNIKLSYPQNNSQYVTGKSFHHGHFIQTLRNKAATLSNVRLEQGTVTSLLKEQGIVKGVQYKTKTGGQMMAYASLTIVCDGCFSNLRSSLCNNKVDELSYFVGWIAENCQLPYPNHGHMILADPSVILFYSISPTETRCIVDVPGKSLPSIATGELSHYLKTVVAHQIPPELYSVFISSIDKGKLKAIPTHRMSTAVHYAPGAFLIGDALNMRHPSTGGGMTVALSDVVVLRDLLRPLDDLNDAYPVFRHLQSFYTRRKPMAVTINASSVVLYKAYGAPRKNVGVMELREAGFEYLRLGGVFGSQFTGLISGLNPSRLSLLLLFSYVTIYSVGRLFLPFPSTKGILSAARLIWGSGSIILALWDGF